MNKKIIRTILLCSLFSAAVSLTSATILSANNKKVEVVYAASDSASSYWNSWISSHNTELTNGGTSLATALHNKIATNATKSYDSLWSFYATGDVVPGYENDSNANKKIWDMYGGYFFTYQSGGKNYSKPGDCYNREHSIPNSWWGGVQNVPQYADRICLLPTDGKINQVRSSYMFGEVNDASQ